MDRVIALARRLRLHLLVGSALVVGGLAALPVAASAAGPGTWTQADVNASIDQALAYLDGQQNSDGSWGVSEPGAETALALGAYGVKGYANLSASEQTQVQNGLNWLLGTQCVGASPPSGCGGVSDGSFNNDFLRTYDTGTALIALSLLGDVPTTADKPTAVTIARNYLIANQQITANGVGTPCTPGGTFAQGGYFCGGWDYNRASGDTRSDESNTGFALTGLDLSGGVPADVAANNVGWQRNVQQLSSNPGGFPSRNDGGGAYTPFSTSGDFSSNANDNGSLTFGYGYDAVPATDPAVQASIKISQDTLDVYETPGSKTDRVMVYHTAMNEDGSCDPATPGCTWSEGNFEGGYHYSIFALVKGLSQYISPNLADASNFYAKAVDLLLSQQCSGGSCGAGSDGSWPADMRDDASVIGATSFAVLALGRVGAPPDQPITATGTTVNATEGHSSTSTVATFTDPDTAALPGDYSASITWGDGSTSTGTITGSGGNFNVAGTHAYAEEGTFTVKVTITDADNTSNTSTATSTAKVADAALHAKSGSPTVSGRTASGTVATFTDDDPAGTVKDYTASINWGDGSTSSGTVTAGKGNFKVGGSHTYKKNGTYQVTVTIKDAGGSTATAAETIKISVIRGHAALKGVSATSACVRGPLRLHIQGKNIASVRWSLDGRPIAGRTVHAGRLYAGTVRLSPGSHRLTAKVRYRRSAHTAARTFARTVFGCRAPTPKFTG